MTINNFNRNEGIEFYFIIKAVDSADRQGVEDKNITNIISNDIKV